MNRRQLLQTLSLSLAASGLPASAAYAEDHAHVSASDRIAVGVIGPGSRGLELIRQLLRTPGTAIAAVADVYEPRFAEVDDLVGTHVPHYTDYREMLVRKDLDAIFIASPPAFHAEHVIASIESGRPVYGEKTLAFSPADCGKVLASVTKHQQIFQIGHQYRYASWYQQAIKRIRAGEIGEPTHVYGYWHRSDNWRRPVTDPSLEHLMNWRLYRETSGGLLEELGSHQIEVANWIFGEQPASIVGTTSNVANQDGRTVGDNVQAVLSYSKGRRMLFSSISDNRMLGDQLWIYGTEGSVQLTIEDATFYGEKRRDLAKPVDAKLKRGLATGASFTTSFAMPYRGPGDRIAMQPGEDPTRTACAEFIRCVRQRQQPFADAHVGYATAMPVAIGRTAIHEQQGTAIPSLSV